jgi:hypothetical protein
MFSPEMAVSTSAEIYHYSEMIASQTPKFTEKAYFSSR